ncbi:hypothetical protein CHH91_04235 [Virgibacillus sp. 7505]|nr:hypothetical protein CHH91_04235 [Virgibacillus sp. 7505]
MNMNTNKIILYFWLVVIAIIAFFTGEIATFMMLYLILMALHAIHSTLIDFYNDWKSSRY